MIFNLKFLDNIKSFEILGFEDLEIGKIYIFLLRYYCLSNSSGNGIND